MRGGRGVRLGGRGRGGKGVCEPSSKRGSLLESQQAAYQVVERGFFIEGGPEGL